MRDTVILNRYLTKILQWHILLASASNPAPIFYRHVNDLKDELNLFLAIGKVGKFGRLVNEPKG